MTTAVTSGKTFWFWLAFIAVLLVGATEAVSNLMWKTVEFVSPVAFIGIGTAVVMLVLAGVGLQVVLWEVSLREMESRLDKLHQIHQKKLSEEEGRKRAKIDEGHRAEEKRQKKQEDIKASQKAIAEKRDEDRRLAAEKRDEDLRLAAQKRDEDLRLARQIVHDEKIKQAADAALQRQANIKREAELKARLEKQGLAYYPKATTLHNGRNAEDWARLANNPANAKVQEATATALHALKEEGMRFLLQFLENARSAPGRDLVLRFIEPDYIHYNDLKKIVFCLDMKQCANPARMRSLKILSMRKESKTHIEQIEKLVADLKNSPQYKVYIKERLDAINDAASTKPEK